MNTRTLAHRLAGLASAVALAASLGACGSAAAVPAVASAESGITVNATASVKVAPDTCSFSVTIVSLEDDAPAAQSANAAITKQVIDKLTKMGVDKAHIQTTYVDVSQAWGDEGPLDSFEARTSLQVKDVSVEEAGTLMQAATDAGATEVGGLQYATASYEDAYQEALVQAVENARPKAEAIAQAGGVKLGGVTAVTEGYQDRSYATEEAMAMSADAGEGAVDMELAPGEVSVEARVTVTFAVS